ncbi:hypothetical protein FRB95_008697 [Tulasnella sp. JGI-2019a]|nr:hypothetical protein FRB95_008697 [Tulasnella sp. JGI-2019a]
MGTAASHSASPDAPPSRALHVLRVIPGSPASLAGIQVFFDFIVGIDGNTTTESTIDAANLEQIVESHEGRHLNLIVWSSKLRSSRIVSVVPSRQWALSPPPSSSTPLQTQSSINEKPSLLGLSMRLCQPEFALDHVWHILEILEGSPAESAGLVPFGDWVVGWSGGTLTKEGDFYDVIEQHVEKPLRVYVYSYDFDTLREVVLVPNRMWGGAGLLGCGVGYGLLHRIPSIQNGSDEVDLTADTDANAKEKEEEGLNGQARNDGGHRRSSSLFVPADEYPEYDASAALNGRTRYGHSGGAQEEEGEEEDHHHHGHDHIGHNGHSQTHSHEEADHHDHHNHDRSGHSHSHDHNGHSHSHDDGHEHLQHDHNNHNHGHHDHDHDHDHDDDNNGHQVRSGAPSPSSARSTIVVNSSVHAISAPTPQKVPPPLANLDLSSPISPAPPSRPFSHSGEAALAEYRRRSATPDSIKRSMSPSTNQRVEDVMGVRRIAGSPRLAAFAGIGGVGLGQGERRSSWNMNTHQMTGSTPSTPKAESMLSKSHRMVVDESAEDGSDEADTTTLDGSLTSVD